MTLESLIWGSAFLLPLFIAYRWKGIGFGFSLFFGWGIIHLANLVIPHNEPIDAIFTGLWVALGWLYMAVYCGFIVVVWIFFHAARNLIHKTILSFHSD
jgi:TRAP-type C4-dicarboxylate transport system permease small subunit